MSHDQAAVARPLPPLPAAGQPQGRDVSLLGPLRWYVKWVRQNPENAASMERMSRTIVMILSDPTNLVSMEAGWAASKLHAFSNQAIAVTAGHRVTTAEILTLVLQAVQEVECLMELVVRKYKGHTATWNAIVMLEAVKCTMNACAQRQLFLVPWLWASLKLSLYRAVRGLAQRASKLLTVGGGASSGYLSPQPSSGARRGHEMFGSVVGPNNTRLVIPRVVADHSRDYEAHNDGKESEEENDDENIPFSWIDLLGMLLDVYLLVRPLVVVATARTAFLKQPEEQQKLIAMVAPPAAVPAAVEGASGKATPAADPFAMIRAAIQATPQQTLFPSWRRWAVLAAMDWIVSLLARFVRHHRVPVVYIEGAPEEDDVMAEEANRAAGGESLSPEERVRRAARRDAGEGYDDEDDDEMNENGSQGSPNDMAVVPPPIKEAMVVSRDRLRLQHSLRNLVYGFLRDPFFTAIVKQFVYDHLVTGFVNKIPLVGSIVGYQVSYFLAMQHYSFLYSVGQ